MSEKETVGEQHRDPSNDPQACSLCGCYIGFGSGGYCDGCAREVGEKPPLRNCVQCGQSGPEEQMKRIDVSGPEEYYPQFRFLCRSCSGGEAGAE
jgi:hypothetical protein